MPPTKCTVLDKYIRTCTTYEIFLREFKFLKILKRANSTHFDLLMKPGANFGTKIKQRLNYLRDDATKKRKAPSPSHGPTVRADYVLDRSQYERGLGTWQEKPNIQILLSRPTILGKNMDIS